MEFACIMLYPFFVCFNDLETGPDRSRPPGSQPWLSQVLAQVDQNKEIRPLSSDGATVLMESGRPGISFRYDFTSEDPLKM